MACRRCSFLRRVFPPADWKNLEAVKNRTILFCLDRDWIVFETGSFSSPATWLIGGLVAGLSVVSVTAAAWPELSPLNIVTKPRQTFKNRTRSSERKQLRSEAGDVFQVLHERAIE